MGEWLSPQLLVFTAGGVFAIAYLIINQVVLRLTLLLGSFLYIAYYFAAADQPLWDAIYTSAVMIVCNTFGLMLLLARNFEWIIPRDFRDLYPQFSSLLPGDFRLIVRPARRFVPGSDMTLTTEGTAATHLYYVIAGNVVVEKQGETFALPQGVFVGEVAYMTGRNSSATSRLPAGAEVLEWSFADLARYSRKNARFALALEAVISRDLALKVSVAIAPSHQRKRIGEDGPVPIAGLPEQTTAG